jgi:hypothetical protein
MSYSILDRTNTIDKMLQNIEDLSINTICDLLMEVHEIIHLLTLLKQNAEIKKSQITQQLRKLANPQDICKELMSPHFDKQHALLPGEIVSITQWEEIQSAPLYWHKTEKKYGIKINGCLITGNILDKSEFDVRNWIPNKNAYYMTNYRHFSDKDTLWIYLQRFKKRSEGIKQCEIKKLTKTTMHDLLLTLCALK